MGSSEKVFLYLGGACLKEEYEHEPGEKWHGLPLDTGTSSLPYYCQNS